MRIEPHFFAEAKKLRAEYEKNFKNPLRADEKRFVWDYWFVEDQYRHLRTPAYHYFSPNLYRRFHKHLVLWGRENLGCWDVSPPWLSYYINGCRQTIHQDVPHGPWAFVFSLTFNPKNFSGGETMILREENPLTFSGVDEKSLKRAKRISARFNQLLVFDPRIPHGVSEVSGTMNPLEARLVIHGWFTEPKTYVDGPLRSIPAMVERVLNSAVDQIQSQAEKCDELLGTLAIRLQVNSSGAVQALSFPTHNLWSADQNQSAKQLLSAVKKIYMGLRFSVRNGDSSITVPLLFSAP